jgi:hypothetical protein
MNLNNLSNTVSSATGSGLGFVIKSLAHPERRYRVCFKFRSGLYGITRIDSGAGAKKDFIVSGLEDRYDFAIPMNRVREVYSERTELLDQKATIESRILELDAIIDGVGSNDMGLDATGTDEE